MGRSLWKTLIRPDLEELENAERMEVARAANELEVGEFQLIQLAYREWHGKDMPDGMIDTLFYAYMIENEVPHWVRHYARQILRLAEVGRLDAQSPQYHRYDTEAVEPAPFRHRSFTLATVFLILAVGGGFLLASQTTKESVTLLPPYFSQDHLKKASGEAPPPRRRLLGGGS